MAGDPPIAGWWHASAVTHSNEIELYLAARAGGGSRTGKRARLFDPCVNQTFPRRRCLDMSSCGSCGSVCRCCCCHTVPLCLPPAADVLKSSSRAKFSHTLYCHSRKTPALPSFKLLLQLPTPHLHQPPPPSGEREGPHPKFGSRQPVVVFVLHGNHWTLLLICLGFWISWLLRLMHDMHLSANPSVLTLAFLWKGLQTWTEQTNASFVHRCG